MASINQGDDAVERLDNAVTAFEQIMTGPEGQTVQVPGHQPQPTLAERVKQNLKPSTDAAAGYAAQASASAKAADESVKLASQITGLDTVTDAVSLASMPLPDVWSPLVDSLRLVTGKGKEIKVGEDVVARRWEFERLSAATERQKDGKLRLVPAGEPRYEGGALVKERSSTNLYFPHDASVGCTPVGGAAAMSTGAGLLGETQTLKFSEDSTNGSHYLWLRTTGAVTVGDSVSVSVELIVHKAAFNKIRIGCNEMSGADRVTLSVTPDLIGKPQLLTFTGTANAATLRPYVWGMVADSPSWQGDGSLNFEILSVQVEKGPPTSLIPTTTAAATRAAESVWLPGPANNPGYGKSRTYSFEFEVISASQTGYIPFFCDGAYPTRTFVGVWNDGNLMANNDFVKAFTTQYTLKKRNVISATFDYDGGYVMFSLNGGPIVKSPVPCTVKPGQAEVAYDKLEIGALGGGGHQSSIRIRNFRQWNRPSSEAQLRAIK
ncbi:phage head spike fiber domain-containing protein [Aeromonas veronii]